MEKPKMIFHIPLPLDEIAKSGSRIRPLKMLSAFENLGFDVNVVSGYGKERKTKIKSLINRIKKGEKFDFMYSESSTQPTLLTEKHHYPTYPRLDFNFFDFCKKNGIKIGLFYRDIQWRFPFYGEGVSLWKKNLALFFYRYDLNKYSKYVDILFLPSKEMANYLPESIDLPIRKLPPGHNIDVVKESYDVNDNLELFYVGGVGALYQMHELFKVSNHDNVTIKFSTREDDWQKVSQEYSNLNVVQKVSFFGNELREQFEKTHIGLIFVKPIEYWTFVMPVKLFEYIGNGIPIIASEGTLTASFIKKYDIGWVIPYDGSCFDDLITHILNNREEIIEKRNNILKIHKDHSWLSRAQKVVDCLV